MPNTPGFSLPYPAGSDPADIPGAIEDLALATETALDTRSTPAHGHSGVLATDSHNHDATYSSTGHTHSGGVPTSAITSKGDLLVANGADSVTRLAVGSNGQYLTSNGSTAAWASGGGGGGGMTLISTLTPGVVSTVQFTSIPQGYKHLVVSIRARSDYSGYHIDYMNVKVNNATSIYAGQRLWVNTSGTAQGGAAGGTTMTNIVIPSNTASTKVPTTVEVEIFDYSSTTRYKNLSWIESAVWSATVSERYFTQTEWVAQTTSAITSLEFTITGNFVSGTTFSLYGRS